MDGAVYVFTEGETDRAYIQRAVEGSGLGCRCVFPRLARGRGGYGTLDHLYSGLRDYEGDSVRIFVYDGDRKRVPEPFEGGDNHTYRFCLPLPSHRGPGDMISIEHYFTDDQLKTYDENGRRLFLAGEFDDDGICEDGCGRYLSLYMKSRRAPEREGRTMPDPLRILDGSGAYRVVDLTCGKNAGLPKSVFAGYVLEGRDGFAFPLGEFGRIVGRIGGGAPLRRPAGFSVKVSGPGLRLRRREGLLRAHAARRRARGEILYSETGRGHHRPEVALVFLAPARRRLASPDRTDGSRGLRVF